MFALVQVARERGGAESQLLAEPERGDEPALHGVVEPALPDFQEGADIIGGEQSSTVMCVSAANAVPLCKALCWVR
jgi:hypothetical protein